MIHLPPPPVSRLIGFVLKSIEPGHAIFEMEADERHHNPMGTLHGGIYCDLADAAMSRNRCHGEIGGNRCQFIFRESDNRVNRGKSVEKSVSTHFFRVVDRNGIGRLSPGLDVPGRGSVVAFGVAVMNVNRSATTAAQLQAIRAYLDRFGPQVLDALTKELSEASSRSKEKSSCPFAAALGERSRCRFVRSRSRRTSSRRKGGRIFTPNRRRNCTHQVICVTRLPEVASYARHHWTIRKARRGKRTVTQIQMLEDSERLEELASMLRGEARGETTRQEAAAMLEAARRRW